MALFADLGFLVGHWVSEREDQNEELWMEPKGGIMLGLNRSLRKSGEATYEFCVLKLGRWHFLWRARRSQATTEFALAELGKIERCSRILSTIFRNGIGIHPRWGHSERPSERFARWKSIEIALRWTLKQ
ncbi:MAG: DUF6265 family protein [Fimbriimonadaceae bacterium]